MTLDQARYIIRACDKSNQKLINWNNTILVAWYHNVLVEHNAITKNAIWPDNLVLKITSSNKEEKFIKRNTDEELITLKEDLGRDGKVSCHLVYVPTAYCMLSEAYFEWSGENGKADKALRLNQKLLEPIKNFEQSYGGI